MAIVQHVTFYCDCCDSDYPTLKEARKCAASHTTKSEWAICTICGCRLFPDRSECCTLENLHADLERHLSKRKCTGSSAMEISWNQWFDSAHSGILAKIKKAQEEELNGLQHVQNS